MRLIFSEIKTFKKRVQNTGLIKTEQKFRMEAHQNHAIRTLTKPLGKRKARSSSYIKEKKKRGKKGKVNAKLKLSRVLIILFHL